VSRSYGSFEFTGRGGVFVLNEVPVFAGGWVSPQARAGCDYFWYWNCIALSYEHLKHHTVMVRLYRPGCQTVEVSSWSLPEQVVWTGVADLKGQENAVDNLVAAQPFPFFPETPEERNAKRAGQESPGSMLGCLAPGSESPEHRKALLFAASEYERLAREVPAGEEGRRMRDRMEGKARWLRERADQ
jgi:hypothetical protein